MALAIHDNSRPVLQVSGLRVLLEGRPNLDVASETFSRIMLLNRAL